jgi:hypothetical protein
VRAHSNSIRILCSHVDAYSAGVVTATHNNIRVCGWEAGSQKVFANAHGRSRVKGKALGCFFHTAGYGFSQTSVRFVVFSICVKHEDLYTSMELSGEEIT